MKTEKVKLRDKEVDVREITAYEFDKALEQESRADQIMNIVTHSTSLSEEDYKSLLRDERELILKAVNQINGLGKVKEEN